MILKDSNRRVNIEIVGINRWLDDSPILFEKEYDILACESIWNDRYDDWECMREIDTIDAEAKARAYADENDKMVILSVLEEYQKVASNNAVTDIYMRRDGMSKAEAERSTKELSNDVYDSICAGASFCEIEDMLLSEGFEMDYLLDLI